MYHYISSGKEGMDLLYVTKTGKAIGLPKGIIIPIGYFYVPEYANSVNNWIRCHSLHKGMVLHHSEDENTLLAIRTPEHYVNRFGIFVTKADLFGSSSDNYDIPDGALRRITVQNIQEADPYL